MGHKSFILELSQTNLHHKDKQKLKKRKRSNKLTKLAKEGPQGPAACNNAHRWVEMLQ